MIEKALPLVCIGCGCSDGDACVSHGGAVRCAWLIVGGEIKVSRGITFRPGLCSCCQRAHSARWNAGDWTLFPEASDRARCALATTTHTKLREVQRCRSCNARMIWLDTAAGKSMPVDADSVAPDDVLFDKAKHMSHFVTCPNAKLHRRAR